MGAKKLLIATASIETATGLMLLVSPTLVVAFLLGASLDAPAALVVARMAGAAVLSLGCACWLARNDGPNRAVRGLVAAMLLYNGVAVAILASAGAGARLVGVLAWPAVALHAALAVWCIVCLRTGPVNSGTGEAPFPREGPSETPGSVPNGVNCRAQPIDARESPPSRSPSS